MIWNDLDGLANAEEALHAEMDKFGEWLERSENAGLSIMPLLAAAGAHAGITAAKSVMTRERLEEHLAIFYNVLYNFALSGYLAGMETDDKAMIN